MKQKELVIVYRQQLSNIDDYQTKMSGDGTLSPKVAEYINKKKSHLQEIIVRLTHPNKDVKKTKNSDKR